MSMEEIREKFVLVWKQIEDFVPMGSKEEGESMKRKGLRLEQESPKKGRIVGNKMLKAFPLPVMSSHCQKTFPFLVKKGESMKRKGLRLEQESPKKVDATHGAGYVDLEVGKKLSQLIRNSSSQTPGGEHGKWQKELSQVANELMAVLCNLFRIDDVKPWVLQIVTNPSRASTLAATDAATLTLRHIKRVLILCKMAEELDCLYALACRVLLGLARDDIIAHILKKLQVGKKLSQLIRNSSSQTPGGEHGKWQKELSQVANELMA
nr:DDB1- and CUL4-associated factor homolog 1 [Tanacetum cinerariifolium]